MNCVTIVPLIVFPFLSKPIPECKIVAGNYDVKVINKAFKLLHLGTNRKICALFLLPFRRIRRNPERRIRLGNKVFDNLVAGFSDLSDNYVKT